MERPGATCSSLEQPGAASSSQELPGAACGLDQLTAWTSLEQPGAASSSQEQPFTAGVCSALVLFHIPIGPPNGIEVKDFVLKSDFS